MSQMEVLHLVHSLVMDIILKLGFHCLHFYTRILYKYKEKSEKRFYFSSISKNVQRGIYSWYSELLIQEPPGRLQKTI